MLPIVPDISITPVSLYTAIAQSSTMIVVSPHTHHDSVISEAEREWWWVMDFPSQQRIWPCSCNSNMLMLGPTALTCSLSSVWWLGLTASKLLAGNMASSVVVNLAVHKQLYLALLVGEKLALLAVVNRARQEAKKKHWTWQVWLRW